MSNTNGDYPTTLGADAVFKGELKFEKAVRLLGRFEGQVESKGEFVVAEGANLAGEVSAGSIRVEGAVKGDLRAGQKIQLASSGRLEGDITTTRLEVADGAVLIGRCVVGANSNGAMTPPREAKDEDKAKHGEQGGKKGEPEAAGVGPGVGVHPRK